MSCRSQKILGLVKKRDKEVKELLARPQYESTKGSSNVEKETAILNFFEEVSSSLPERQTRQTRQTRQKTTNNEDTSPNEDVTSTVSEPEPFEDSGDEYIPPSESESGSEDNSLFDLDSISSDIKEKLNVDNSALKRKKEGVKKSFYKKVKEDNETELIPKAKNIEYNFENIVEESKKNTSHVKKKNDEDRDRDSEHEKEDENEDSNYNEQREITVSTTKKTDEGKRVRDKRHCCFVCNKLLTNNMARHFELVHGNDVDVAKILIMPKKSKARREAFDNLIKYGDFFYNMNVLTVKEGELILSRRPNEDNIYSYDAYVPCTYCLGFMHKKYLWVHVNRCKSKKNKIDTNLIRRRGHKSETAALLFNILGPKADTCYQREIISTFKIDQISTICKEDDLIVTLGGFLYEKYGVIQAELIRQSMRQLGRLKQELQNEVKDRKLSEWLTPKHFDAVVAATKNICGNDYANAEILKRNDFKIPSLALKIGHLIRKCVSIEIGKSLRKGDVARHNELKAFTEIMDLEWSIRISSKALNTMYKNKMNSAQLLPLTSDLMKLNQFLEEKLNMLLVLVAKECTKELWTNLASVTLCRIILFNKRRSGEASRMTLENYNSRPSWSQQGTQEFVESLSPLEQELANRLTVIEIVGKRNRKVPVILTEVMKTAVDLLIKTRKEGNISKDNLYVFARSEKSKLNSHLRGSDCLRDMCKLAELTSAENINATKLRKYVATVCQIFDLKENECDWLARHLGHDIRVHRDFYRMHDSAIELTKISRLLLAVDKGEARKYAGKQLKDINVEDLPPLELEDENDEQDETLDKAEESEINPINTDEGTSVGAGDVGKRSTSSGTSHKVLAVSKKTCKKKLWTIEETKCLLKHFSSHIKNGTLPGKAACQELMEQYPHLFKDRKWEHLKFYIKNHKDKIKKNLSAN